jgi:antitoxin component of RelBE/YafQ-DinJ toxin-antitoxin module
VGQDRHVSVRVSSDLAAGLEDMAAERGLTLSQLVRELIAEAVVQRASVAGSLADHRHQTVERHHKRAVVECRDAVLSEQIAFGDAHNDHVG